MSPLNLSYTRQVGALVGAWVAGSLALVLVIRLFLRAVRATRFTWLCVQRVYAPLTVSRSESHH